jgi:hypothetical protein
MTLIFDAYVHTCYKYYVSKIYFQSCARMTAVTTE